MSENMSLVDVQRYIRKFLVIVGRGWSPPSRKLHKQYKQSQSDLPQLAYVILEHSHSLYLEIPILFVCLSVISKILYVKFLETICLTKKNEKL